MLSTYPMPTPHLGYETPNGELELLTLTELIERGPDALVGTLRNEVSMGLPDQVESIAATLLYLVTGRDEHAVLASGPLVEELKSKLTTADYETLAASVERLEALKNGGIDEELAEVEAEPVDDPRKAMRLRVNRIGRNMQAAWLIEGRIARPVVRALEPRTAQPRAREHRATRSRGSRTSSSSDDPDLEPPPLGGFRRLLALLRGMR